jgi:polysaccharide export outer membrane protein
MNWKALFTLAASAVVIGAAETAAQTPAPVAVSLTRLKPGDVVRVWVWRDSAYSGEFAVPANGMVVLPRMGELRVTDLNAQQLRDTVVAALSKYLNHRSIEVTVKTRVNILGAVRNPNLYFVDETMTIADALALAGGAERDGKQDQVDLVRDGTRINTNITRRTRISDLALQSGDQLFVPEKSWLARNTPIVAALVSGVASVAVALIVRN